MSDKTCGTCRWFKPNGHVAGNKQRLGHCYRMPPVVVKFSARRPFLVEDEEACGEWAAKGQDLAVGDFFEGRSLDELETTLNDIVRDGDGFKTAKMYRKEIAARRRMAHESNPPKA